MEVSNTIVVFDLDETLGHFVEIGVFWDALQKVYGPQDSYHFFEVMDLFPEFFKTKHHRYFILFIRTKITGIL